MNTLVPSSQRRTWTCFFCHFPLWLRHLDQFQYNPLPRFPIKAREVKWRRRVKRMQTFLDLKYQSLSPLSTAHLFFQLLNEPPCLLIHPLCSHGCSAATDTCSSGRDCSTQPSSTTTTSTTSTSTTTIRISAHHKTRAAHRRSSPQKEKKKKKEETQSRKEKGEEMWRKRRELFEQRKLLVVEWYWYHLLLYNEERKKERKKK